MHYKNYSLILNVRSLVEWTFFFWNKEWIQLKYYWILKKIETIKVQLKIAFTKGAITQLIEFTQSDSYPFPQYSSWLLMHVMENHPDSMDSFHNQLVDAFLSCKEPSTQRNLANVLLKYPYTAYREGELLESFFDLLQDSSTKVALKAYSMYHLVRFLDRYPTLKNEFKSILEEGMRKESAAYIVAANKVLKAIEKIP